MIFSKGDLGWILLKILVLMSISQERDNMVQSYNFIVKPAKYFDFNSPYI